MSLAAFNSPPAGAKDLLSLAPVPGLDAAVTLCTCSPCTLTAVELIPLNLRPSNRNVREHPEDRLLSGQLALQQL